MNEELPSVQVVKALARVQATDPTAIRPLYEYVDPEALDALIGSTPGVTVEFEYTDYIVTITGGDPLDVSVHPLG